MNVWLAIALLAIVVTVTGVGAIFLLTKSIGFIAENAVKNKWQHDYVTRLLRRVALLGSAILLLNLLPWTVLLTTVGGMADQYFRNIVNQWMSGAELFQHLALNQDEYYSQPLHWRQALAEITLRQGDEEEALKQFISRLGTRDIRILESVAKYTLSGALLELRSSSKGDPIHELSAEDLVHLEAIGVIDSRIPLNHKRIRTATDAMASDNNTDNLWLAGHQYAIHLRASTSGNGASLSFIALTHIGNSLVRALRRPSTLLYLCFLQRHFRDQKISAEVWSITRQGLKGDSFRPISSITDVCESINVSTQESPDDPR